MIKSIFMNKKRFFLLAFPWILFVVFFGASLFFWNQSLKKEANSEMTKKNKFSDTVMKVSKIFLLPANEIPQITEIDDLSTLDTNPFFAHAEIKDEVLIYLKAKEAILYRPSTNMVIEVATLNDSPIPDIKIP